MMTRLETQALLRAGHTQADIAQRLHISERSIRDIGQEPLVTPEALLAPPPGRGRPSKVEPFRNRIATLLIEEPELPVTRHILLRPDVLQVCVADGWMAGIAA